MMPVLIARASPCAGLGQFAPGALGSRVAILETLNREKRQIFTCLVVAVGPWAKLRTIEGAKVHLGAALPNQLFRALPFILSILAPILMSRRAELPVALMAPDNKGEH